MGPAKDDRLPGPPPGQLPDDALVTAGTDDESDGDGEQIVFAPALPKFPGRGGSGDPHSSSSDGTNGGWPRGNVFESSNQPKRRDAARDLKRRAADALRHRPHHHQHHHHGARHAHHHHKKISEKLERIGLLTPEPSTSDEGSHAALKKKQSLKGVASPVLAQTARLVAHPKRTLKAKLTSTVASEISGLNRPYVPPTADLELMAAHVQRDRAQDPREVEDATRSIATLRRRRKNLQIGWTMGRHIHTVRATAPTVRPWPEKRRFVLRDEATGHVLTDNVGNEQVDWLKWLGHFLLYMTQDFTYHYIEEGKEQEPLSMDKMRDIAERIFVASAPWQEWYLHVRSVYRWEDPYETFRWFLLYVVLWYYQRIGAFLYGYICYGTLRNYFFPSTVEELAASIERGRSRTRSALQFGDLVAQYGPEGWLYPLAEELGPWAQLQLGDLANLLEVLKNFWECASPRQTLYTLCFFMTCFAVAMIADMAFCMKGEIVVYFIVGGTFFFSFPVSSHYPRYRYLVSTLKWAFWNVPTHAEWAFEELRLAAQNHREEVISSKIEQQFWGASSNPYSDQDSPYVSAGSDQWEEEDEDEDEDEGAGSDAESFLSAKCPSPLDGNEEFAAFECRCGVDAGSLAIMPDGLLFRTRRRRQQLWRMAWGDIFEVRKVGRRHGAAKLVSSKRALEISFTDRSRVRIDDLGRVRDEVFNRIVGYSGLRWQWIK